MTEWTFTFWQVLLMILIAGEIGVFIGEVKRARYELLRQQAKKPEPKQVENIEDDEDTIEIFLFRVENRIFAVDVELRKVIAAADNGKDLREMLGKVNPNATWVTDDVGSELLGGE